MPESVAGETKSARKLDLEVGLVLGLGLGFVMARPLSVVTFGVSLKDPVRTLRA